jgi:hypothetical protein
MQSVRIKHDWKRIVGVAVVVTAVVALPGVSLVKYAMYELSGAAPTLRNSVGKRVILPKQEWEIRSRTVTTGLDECILEQVSYRWNDKLGFFDLVVGWSDGVTGLSPFEAMEVKVLEFQDGAVDGASRRH